MEKFSLFSDMQIRGVMKGAQILLGILCHHQCNLGLL